MIVLSDLTETLRSEKEFVMPNIVTEFTKYVFAETSFYLENPMEVFSNPIIWIIIILLGGLLFRFALIITDEFKFIRIDEQKGSKETLD